MNFSIEMVASPLICGDLSNLPHFSALEGECLRRSSRFGTFFASCCRTYVSNLRIWSAVNASIPRSCSRRPHPRHA